MEHLYGMGESSAAFNRSLNVGKDTMMAAAAIYQGKVKAEPVVISSLLAYGLQSYTGSMMEVFPQHLR